MSEQTQEPTATKPVAEHEWLNQLLGEWDVKTEMRMGPDQPMQTGTGTEKVTSLGGLWAYTEGEGTMPDGNKMKYFQTLGYDVSFKEYRGGWFADVSSHLWKYVGEMSPDGKKLKLTCEGPHMEKDGETAMYEDTIELVDENTRTLTSRGQDDEGNWMVFMTSTLTRKR